MRESLTNYCIIDVRKIFDEFRHDEEDHTELSQRSERLEEQNATVWSSVADEWSSIDDDRVSRRLWRYIYILQMIRATFQK